VVTTGAAVPVWTSGGWTRMLGPEFRSGTRDAPMEQEESAAGFSSRSARPIQPAP
jgi:hypothetical protein